MKLKRVHARAPLSQEVLYIEAGHVFSSKSLNISEGGILLNSMPIIPKSDKISILLNLPVLPLFEDLMKSNRIGLDLFSFELSSMRMNMHVVRRFEGKSEVEKVFETHIGCNFLSLNSEYTFIIKSYVEIARLNIKYLLGLFEGAEARDIDHRDSNFKSLISLASVLGHNPYDSPKLIRNKLLSDYQSLI